MFTHYEYSQTTLGVSVTFYINIFSITRAYILQINTPCNINL